MKGVRQSVTFYPSYSCGTSFVKIYEINYESDSLRTLLATVDPDRRKKIGHFCNNMLNDREVTFDFKSRLEVVLVQCKFDILFDFNAIEGNNIFY
jgi:hypothetical protein